MSTGPYAHAEWDPHVRNAAPVDVLPCLSAPVFAIG